jgi:hypothetical protein
LVIVIASKNVVGVLRYYDTARQEQLSLKICRAKVPLALQLEN